MSRAVIAALAAFAGVRPILADEAPEPVIVTASRIPEPADEVFFSTSVIARDDIVSSQLESLPELLARLPGVSTDNAGGLGKASAIFIRGANADHTLLLIDGQRVASSTLGTAPFELIPVQQIDHIEVVRGPRSTLYGSDAIGGVVQIFTRRTHEPGLAADASAGTGSYDTHEFTGSLQAAGTRLWANLGADVLTTGGIASCLPGAPSFSAGCGLTDPGTHPDGYQNRSGSVSAGAALGEHATLEGSWLGARGFTEYAGGYQNNTNFHEEVGTLRLDLRPGGDWHVRLSGGRDRDRQANYLDRNFSSEFDTTRDDAGLQVDGSLVKGLRLVTGLDYEHEHIDTDANDTFPVTSRSTRGVFAELHAEHGPWSALAGGRAEHNSQFGGRNTGNLGIGRRLLPGVRWVASWGTAFHAPTFNDLYFPFFGNPALRPETSRSLETGIDANRGPWQASLHLFQTDIDHLVAYDARTNYTPENIDRARIRGAELQGSWEAADWRVSGQLTQMQPLNLSTDPATHDALLPRRPRTAASLALRRRVHASFGPVTGGALAATARYGGHRYDDVANTLPLGGYATLDLTTEWQLGRHFVIQGIAANVTDRKYQTAAYFAQLGRHYELTLRYRTRP